MKAAIIFLILIEAFAFCFVYNWFSKEIVFVFLFLLSVINYILFLYYLFSKVIIPSRIKKNRQKYFEQNKKLCTKLKKKGHKIKEQYPLYLTYLQDLDLNKTEYCSNSIVSNAKNNPKKYILKYSDIDNSIEDIEKLEFISLFMSNYNSFKEDMEDASITISDKLPLLYQVFSDKEKLPYQICGLSMLYNLEMPFLHFVYSSPAGRAYYATKLTIDEDDIQELIEEISKSISKKGYTKYQRSIMSNDLREAIKQRDNYTCCKCGNSVYKEPNLLLEVDHIIPISKGGKTEASNLQTLCWRCNRKKSNN